MAIQYAYKPHTSVFDCTDAVLPLGGATKKISSYMFLVIENFNISGNCDFQ